MKFVNFPDQIAPRAAPQAVPAPNGGGWNSGNVTVTWNWSDNLGGDGIDPARCATSGVSSGEGALVVAALCQDLAGNVGSAQYTVKVDKTGPSVSITSPADAPYENTGQLTIAWTASDALSLLATQSATFDGSPATNGQVIDLFLLPLGTHAVVVTATDNAGNQSSDTATFAVVATAESVSASVDRLLDLGAITHEGVANSLKAKLGKNPNQLTAFLNELEAQRGKKISDEAYALLQALALDLMSRL